MAETEVLNLILSKLDSFEKRFDNLETRFDNLETRFDNLESRFDKLEVEVKEVKEEVKELKAEVKEVKEEVKEVKEEVEGIKLTMENEIRVNIQRVAEGHLDLSRNLQTVMKPSNEFEMLAVRVNMLESEMREVKRKIS